MPDAPPIRIRPATRADLPTLGRLGASLMRLHHGFDPQRFMAPPADADSGYAWFLGTQLTDDEAAVLVAEPDGQPGTVLGYVYARLEPLSWEDLRDPCGFIHDVVVAETARGGGVGRALVEAALDWCRAKGMPRVVLSTGEPNEAARRLFTALGFRRTMVEMTREL